MAAGKALNEKNLTKLGAKRLAGLLMEVSQGDAAMKRRLRLELASEAGAGDVAREVRKRLATIARAKSFIDWTKRKPFLTDLQTQRKMIAEKIAPKDPALGLDLLFEYIAMAPSIYERSDDGSGYISDEFYEACALFAEIGPKANVDPLHLAQRVFDSLRNSEYGEFNGLVGYLGPAMGNKGLEHLKTLVIEYSEEPLSEEPDMAENIIHFGGGIRGISLDMNFPKRRRQQFVQAMLEGIANQQGNVDDLIALQTPETLAIPATAAEIAARLLEADRAEEALAILDGIDATRCGYRIPEEWTLTRAATLSALKRPAEAQACLWNAFEKNMNPDFLRELVKILPDFEDFECEQRAFETALSHPQLHAALKFLIEWPSLENASRLVLKRAKRLDGNRYDMLTPAANALQGSYPLAAVLMRRSMIDHSLDKAKSTRYKHAARHLLECQSADSVISDYETKPDHQQYLASLKEKHGRKTSFWNNLPPDE